MTNQRDEEGEWTESLDEPLLLLQAGARTHVWGERRGANNDDDDDEGGERGRRNTRGGKRRHCWRAGATN